MPSSELPGEHFAESGKKSGRNLICLSHAFGLASRDHFRVGASPGHNSDASQLAKDRGGWIAGAGARRRPLHAFSAIVISPE
jgi:hypothetical protein